MMTRTLTALIAVLGLLVSPGEAAAQASADCDSLVAGTPVPDLPASNGVVDDAEVLSDRREQQLAERLRRHAESTQVQIAILTTLDTPGSLACYALHVARSWGVGQRGMNNGLLIALAPEIRQVRVEVGYGLEWQIPDSTARDIVREMGPRFAAGDIYGGLQRGLNALIARSGSVPWTPHTQTLESIRRAEASWTNRVVRFDARIDTTRRPWRALPPARPQATDSLRGIPLERPPTMRRRPPRVDPAATYRVYGRIAHTQPTRLHLLGFEAPVK